MCLESCQFVPILFLLCCVSPLCLCLFPLTFDSSDSLVPSLALAMADTSLLMLGTAQSLLDSSVCDSRIAESTKEHLFLGMACEDGEGESVRVCLSRLYQHLRAKLGDTLYKSPVHCRAHI